MFYYLFLQMNLTIVYCDLISGIWRGIWRWETLLDVFMALTNFRSVKQRSYSVNKNPFYLLTCLHSAGIRLCRPLGYIYCETNRDFTGRIINGLIKQIKKLNNFFVLQNENWSKPWRHQEVSPAAIFPAKHRISSHSKRWSNLFEEINNKTLFHLIYAMIVYFFFHWCVLCIF
jgi:hypothetical protein